VLALLVPGLLATPAPAAVDSAVRSSVEPAGSGSQPNIIVILTDDQTPDSFPHSNPVTMPYLQAAVDDPADHWVAFPNAFLNTPLCCPTRATLLSGQYSHHHGVPDNSASALFDETNTLATWLDAAGYHTGLVGKYLNHWPFGDDPPDPAPGWDRWVANTGAALPDYYTYDLSIDGVLEYHGTGAANYNTDVLAGYAVDFVETAPADDPFFLYFAPVAPHGSHVPAPRHANVFKGIPKTEFPNFNEADVSDKPAWIQAKPLLTTKKQNTLHKRRRKAFETLLAVDDAIEAIVAAVEARGELDDTVILFMTDNGYSFGEMRFDGKKCVYEQCIRTPFYIRYPGAAHGTRTELVSSVDVVPTFVELAGAVAGRTMDGMSLVPVLEGTATSWRDGVLVRFVGEKRNAFPGYWAIRTAGYLYAELGTGEKELYDLAVDPYELENEAGDPAYASIQSDLAAELAVLKAS
jgi:N-acetylglucosamine-6-sulfatase